jgi:ubiquinone/menaquinone biosynthesis C-methylase UbiE
VSRFGPDPRAFYDSAYRGIAPWDVGKAQPALAVLFRDHPPTGPVLDVGCGSGDLTIHLAQAGLEVVGIDFSERAIERAREKAGPLPIDSAGSLEFLVADALRPSLLQRRFGAVVDSGFLHVLDPGDIDGFTGELASVLVPGGRYYLLAFRERRRWIFSRRGLSENALRARFTEENGWRIVEMGPAEFQTVKMPMPAIRACIQRLPSAPGRVVEARART